MKKFLLISIVFIQYQCGYSQIKLTLKDALLQARSNNLLYQSVRFDSSIAKSDIITAGLRPNLLFNNQFLQLGSKRYSPDVGANYFSTSNRQVWYQLTKQVQTFNKRKLKVDFASVNSLVVKKNVQEVERNLFLDVATKFIELSYLKRNLDLLDTIKANIDTLVQINKVRLKNEVILPSELIRTKILFEQYSLQYKNTTLDYMNECSVLGFYIGMSPDSILIESTDSPLSYGDQSLDSIIQMAFKHRPDLASAQFEKDLSLANYQLQKAYAFPNLELGVIYNPQNSVPYYGTFATLPIPIFDRNQGEVQKAKTLTLKSNTYYDALKHRITVDVNNTFKSYRLKQENLQQVELILSQSKDVFETIKYAYIKGNTNIIDFLEAQRTYYDAILIFNEAKFNLKKSQIELMYATGDFTSVINQ